MGRAVAFSPGEPALLATEQLPGLFGEPKPEVLLLEVPTGKIRSKPFSCPSPVRSFAFSPDGKYLAVAGNERTLRLRDLAHERQAREFKGHAAPADQVAFSRDGKRLFSVSGNDGTLRVWDNGGTGDVVEQAAVTTDMRKVSSKMTCAALWPGGRALTGHEDGSLVLWDLAAGEEVKRFTHNGSRLTAVAISPDGHHAVAAVASHLVYLYRLPPPAREP
jgi:WD40 repeat protein